MAPTNRLAAIQTVHAASRRREAQTKAWSEPPFWAYDDLWLPFANTTTADQERIENDFQGYVAGAYKTNGVVFACIAARMLVFSEARFQWRRFSNGRPGDLFGDASLALLEQPWLNGTTGDMLGYMEVDGSLAGNAYLTTADDNGNYGRASLGGPGRRIVRMRPDWVTLILDSPEGNPYSLGTKVVGLLYQPRASGLLGTDGMPQDPVILLPNEVCHYTPYPDPTARFRGMSWLTPVLQEIGADKAATVHKGKFFENGGSPRQFIKFDKDVGAQAFDHFVEKYKSAHAGAQNAYRTLVLTPGADIQTVGADLQQLDFKVTQGAGETRICAAARMHPAIVGLSEGLQGASLNAGNFGAAKRLVVDGTMRPLWRKAAASLQTLVNPAPAGASLWYDDRDIAFLREDARDLADIQQTQATTLRQLTDAGWTPDSAKAAIQANDWSKLVHSGLFSVQLQPPGTVAKPQNPGGVADGQQGTNQG